MGARADDDILFETFAHKSGKSHYCLKTNGQRYFLDSAGTGQWQPFPTSWLNDGQFIPDDPSTDKQVKKDGLLIKEHEVEFINIPGKGKVQAQLFESRIRVHCYFDPQEATWIKLPLAWELFSLSTKEIVKLVQDVCPDWSDDMDILAMLRSCNYNVDECVNAFHCTGRRSDVGGAGSSGAPTDLPSRHISFASSRPCSRASNRSTKSGQNAELEGQISEFTENLKSATYRLCQLENELIKEKKAHERVKKLLEQEQKQTGVIKADAEKRDRFVNAAIETMSGIRSICRDMRSTIVPAHVLFHKEVHSIEKALAKFRKSNRKTLLRENELKALYRQEVEKRRQLYNTLIEMRGNIRVYCRIRPVFDGEHPTSDLFETTPDGTLSVKMPNSTQRSYQFDKIFGPQTMQEEIFDELKDLITSIVDGYNVCILAYGQTGSGKTFTMQGPEENPGVNIRALRELLKIIKLRDKTEYSLTISMVEIYNETLIDLISSSNTCEVLELRNLGSTVTIIGATWAPVSSEAEINAVLTAGEKNRRVASTKMNSTSSRSHLIVSVNVVGTDIVSGTVSKGSLILCDLAGSERVNKVGSTKGERFLESTHINLSLTSIGQVFSALRNNHLHVPFRNSKLTQLLQPCLGGESKASLIVNVSTEPQSLPETLSTLLFGANARQVALGPAKANISKISEAAAVA